MKYALFWFSWSISALIAGVVIYFFFAGLVDGTVSSSNIFEWSGILLVVSGVVGGSLWLGRTGHPLIAMLPLLIVLLPGLFFGAYALMFVFGKGRMN